MGLPLWERIRKVWLRRKAPPEITIIWQPTNNYGWYDIKKGRNDFSLRWIVIHHTADNNIDGTISWFKDPSSSASAHFVIGKDGKIVQMVDTNNVAWHCGYINPYSIGIEIVHKEGGFTDKQYDALARLILRLSDETGIPAKIIDNPQTLRSRDIMMKLDFRGIIGHCTVGKPTCPSNDFLWERLKREINNYV